MNKETGSQERKKNLKKDKGTKKGEAKLCTGITIGVEVLFLFMEVTVLL